MFRDDPLGLAAGRLVYACAWDLECRVFCWRCEISALVSLFRCMLAEHATRLIATRCRFLFRRHEKLAVRRPAVLPRPVETPRPSTLSRSS